MEAIIADRGSPQNHVWRCRIVLLTVAGLGTNAIMREAGVAKTAVWRKARATNIATASPMTDDSQSVASVIDQAAHIASMRPLEEHELPSASLRSY